MLLTSHLEFLRQLILFRCWSDWSLCNIILRYIDLRCVSTSSINGHPTFTDHFPQARSQINQRMVPLSVPLFVSLRSVRIEKLVSVSAIISSNGLVHLLCYRCLVPNKYLHNCTFFSRSDVFSKDWARERAQSRFSSYCVCG